MNNVKKTMTLLLIMSVLLGIFAACQKGDGTGDNSSKPAGTAGPGGTNAGTDAKEEYVFPDEKLDGYTVKIFSIMGPQTTWLTFPYFDTEDSSSKISTAIYQRNAQIEETLECKIEETNADASNVELWASLLAEDTDEYQAGVDYSWNSITRAGLNYLVDFGTIDSIDLSKPWWDQNINNAYSLNGHVFVTSGSAMTSSWDEIFVLYFNSTVAGNIDGEMDLYQEVKDGQWTLERFCQLITAGDNDLNDPGAEKEHYGFATQAFYAVPSFMGTNNVTYGILNSDGKIENNTSSDRFINTVQTLAERLPESDSIYYGDAEVDTMFMNGETFFMQECIGAMANMRNLSEFDYGVLPMPKFNESQEQYYSYSGAQYLLFIPYTNANVEKTGVVLEAMMGLSEYTLKQTYIEDMLGQIYSRTPEAAEMMNEYILPNTLYDIGGRQGLQFNTLIPLDQMVPMGMTDVVSAIDAVRDAIQDKIDAVNEFES